MIARIRLALWVLLKGGEDMDAIYAFCIMDGWKTIDNVPEKLKENVLRILARSGLDGYGQPLV